MGDHPPITPTTKLAINLAPEEGKLYDFIARHFLATLSPDAKFEKKTITFAIAGHLFGLKGTTLIKLGFTEVCFF